MVGRSVTRGYGIEGTVASPGPNTQGSVVSSYCIHTRKWFIKGGYRKDEGEGNDGGQIGG